MASGASDGLDDRPLYSGLGGAASHQHSVGTNWGLEVAFWLSLVAFGMILGLTLVSVFEHVFQALYFG